MTQRQLPLENTQRITQSTLRDTLEPARLSVEFPIKRWRKVTAHAPAFTTKTFLFIQILHVFFLLCFHDHIDAIVLFGSGVVNIFLYVALIRVEILKTVNDVSPFIFFLVSSLLRLGVGSCWAAASYHFGFHAPLRIGFNYVGAYLLSGQLLLVAGDLCFIAGYIFWNRRAPRVRTHPSRTQGIGKATSPNMKVIAFLLILTGWSVKILLTLGVPLEKLGMFFAMFAEFASPAGLYLMLVAARHRLKVRRPESLILIGLLFVIEFGLSLRSYMKASTVLLLLPLAIYLLWEINQSRLAGNKVITLKRVLFVTTISLFVGLILFPYSQLRRSAYVYRGSKLVAIPTVAPFLKRSLEGAIPGTDSFRELHAFPTKGFWTFFSRHADVVSSGWCYNYVAVNGNVNGRFIKDALVNCVPRIIWPDKPLYSPGRHFEVMLGSARSFATATSASHPGGLAAGLHLNGGPFYLVAGCFVNGIILCMVWRFTRQHIYSHPLGAILAISLHFTALTHFESDFAGGISTYAYIFIVFFPVILTTRNLFQHRTTFART